MKPKTLLFGLVLGFAFTVPALAQDDAGTLPEEIIVEVPGIQPEGIEYDAAHERFLLGSLTDGKIRQVTDDGTVSVFIEDADIVSSLGLQVDAERNRLLVASADAAVFDDSSNPGRAGLGAYDLDSGERLFYVDLAALASDSQSFANDVAIDADGNAYVTNSFTPVIYKVAPDGTAEVLLHDNRLAGGSSGLNGIDVHPDGYLIAAIIWNSTILKIPLDDPASLTEVQMDPWFAGDGLVLSPDGTLYAVAQIDGGAQQIVAVTSSDDWASGSVQASADTDGSATTLALRDGVPYYIDAHLDNPGATQYEIVRADMEAG